MRKLLKEMKILEKDIQRSILDYLQLKKIFHWRNNSGFMFIKGADKTRGIKLGQTGSPDIFVVLPEIISIVNAGVDVKVSSDMKFGQIFGIEVKAPKGVQSDHQKNWQIEFEKAGGVYILARSVDDIIKFL